MDGREFHNFGTGVVRIEEAELDFAVAAGDSPGAVRQVTVIASKGGDQVGDVIDAK
jgi:hypothetical protein